MTPSGTVSASPAGQDFYLCRHPSLTLLELGHHLWCFTPPSLAVEVTKPQYSNTPTWPRNESHLPPPIRPGRQPPISSDSTRTQQSTPTPGILYTLWTLAHRPNGRLKETQIWPEEAQIRPAKTPSPLPPAAVRRAPSRPPCRGAGRCSAGSSWPSLVATNSTPWACRRLPTLSAHHCPRCSPPKSASPSRPPPCSGSLWKLAPPETHALRAFPWTPRLRA
jgi:hypothetical protein